MLFLRVIVWCGAEKFSLKKSCFYLYIRRLHEPCGNPPYAMIYRYSLIAKDMVRKFLNLFGVDLASRIRYGRRK